MAVYKCRICGAIYDEEKEGKPLSELDGCPVCKMPVSNLVPVSPAAEPAPPKAWTGKLDYDAATARQDSSARYMAEIHEMAVTGKSIGGDYFGNYEGRLPEADGREYHECDIDSTGSYRGAKRLVYSNDGLIYYTEDHYETFELMYGEESP